MKPLRRFFCVLGVLLVTLLINCSSDYESDEKSVCNEPNTKCVTYGTDNDSGREEPYFHILADHNLTEGHKLAILAAIDEWAMQTHFTVKYSLQFVDMSTEPKNLATKHTIRIYVQDPGPNYVGWTEWITSNQSAHILVEPSISDEMFRVIMLHELGHAFDLHFDGDIHYKGPCTSIMFPSLSSVNHLTCIDLQSFCKNYGCQVDCTPVKK